MPVQGSTAPVLSSEAQSTECSGTSVRDSPIGVPNASCRGSGAQPVYFHFRPMPRLCIRRGEESSVPLLQQQLKVVVNLDVRTMVSSTL